MRSKTIEKCCLCFVLILSMSCAVFLYSRPSVDNPSFGLVAQVHQLDTEDSKALPDIKILDFLLEKATALISASYKTSCIR